MMTTWVQFFKLLGITFSHNINWQTHIDVLISKASSWLHFLLILTKAGLQAHHLRHFVYKWSDQSLNAAPQLGTIPLIYSTSGIHRRALHTIYPPTAGMPSVVALAFAQLMSLHDHLQHLSEQFFNSFLELPSCIFPFLPPPRDSSITSRLRTPFPYTCLAMRTKHNSSLIVNY